MENLDYIVMVSKTLSNNCRVDYIGIRYSTCLIVVAGFSIMTTTHDGISAESCTSVNIQYTRIVENALSSGKSGMSFWRCRAFSVWNCEISYHNVVLFAYNSQGVSNNLLAGTGNNYGLYSSYGSIITTIGTQPAATTALVQDAGGMFTYGNGSQISGPFTLGISCTWGNVSGGYVRHGIYSNGQGDNNNKYWYYCHHTVIAWDCILFKWFSKPTTSDCINM